MAHEVFAIEKLGGMVTNQPSRVSGNPIRLVADFDRVGGYSPQKRRSEVLTNERHLGNDWTGVYATIDYAGTPNLYVGYAQTGAKGNASVATFSTNAYTAYVPGGGIYAVDAATVGTSYFVNPSIVGALVVDNDGGGVSLHQNTNPAFGPTISSVGAGSWDAGSMLLALFIYFYRSPHGLVPFAIFYDQNTITTNGRSWRITKTGFYTDPAYVLGAYYYVSGTIGGQPYTFEWHRAYHDTDADSPYVGPGDVIASDTDLTVNASPTLYGTLINSSGKRADQRYQTVSVNRAFYVNTNDVAHKFTYNSALGGLALQRVTSSDPAYEVAYTSQNVFFTDVGHLAFSDNETSPQQIAFDDAIHSITASNRGIYAFSTMATWEAYGDFVSANTRVSLVPVLGGADNSSGNQVTFSGDTAYFVKERIIHSLGPGGVQQVGRDIYMEDDGLYAITYDRYRRRLVAINYDGRTVYEYDPNTKQWAVWPDTTIPGYTAAVGQHTIFTTGPNQYWAGGRLVTLLPGVPLPDIEVVYGKVDMGKPLRRKRIHRIIIPYHGTLIDMAVDIRVDHASTYSPCTVNDRGEYVEVRCPSLVSRSFDISVVASTDDSNFMLSPPWIIEYDVRGPEYGRT